MRKTEAEDKLPAVSIEPHLEMIVGPMFSGKSTELIRRLRRAEIAGLPTILFRPTIDHTSLTHDGAQHEYVTIKNTSKPFLGLEPYSGWVVGIDEVQFLPLCYSTIIDLAKRAVVICSGLDTTFLYEPFSIVPNLMAMAIKVDKLTAICHKCGKEATRSQRIINGEPATQASPTVLVGKEEFYEARCSDCWELKWE